MRRLALSLLLQGLHLRAPRLAASAGIVSIARGPLQATTALLRPVPGAAHAASAAMPRGKKRVAAAAEAADEVEEAPEQDEPEAKPAKGRKQKPAAARKAAAPADGADAEGDEPPTKKGRGKSSEAPKRARKSVKKVEEQAEEEEEEEEEEGKAQDEQEGEEEEEEGGKPKKKKAKRSRVAPKVERERYTEAMRPPVPEGQPVTKVVTWNVAGLRAILKRDAECISKLLQDESVDVICLQETKIADKHVEELKQQMGLPADWHATFTCSQAKQGYSGVATLSRVAPIKTTLGLGVEDSSTPSYELDREGRVIISEFKDIYVVNCYTPNSGQGLVRLQHRTEGDGCWDATLAAKVKELAQHKPVVLVGDLNCAHEEIDIHNPKGNKKSAGFTQEERDSFGSRFLSPVDKGGAGLVDTHRAQWPELTIYTYFSWRGNARAKGIGWRLDYCLVTEALRERVHDAWVKLSVEGSDHLPTGVTLLGSLLA